MHSPQNYFISPLAAIFSLLLLNACTSEIGTGKNSSSHQQKLPGIELKLLVGSALESFCHQSVEKFNQQQPKLDNGTAFHVTCEGVGSNDVVATVLSLAQQLRLGAIAADSPKFPTIISVDGEIYQSQLIYQMSQVYPDQNYIPEITDSPLLASSPIVFMAPSDVATGWKKVADPFKALMTAKNHRQIDPTGPPLMIHYVHTAPTRSNAGLQTLAAQFASVSGKRPEQLTIDDIKRYEASVQQIQSKVTRYGVSSAALAQAMVQNGPNWASLGSVYESSVILANSNLQPGQPRYEAIYPQATFSSNMRAILTQGPWVSTDEKAAAEKFIAYLRSPEAQKIATDLGLRPGTSGVALGPKFTAEFGVGPEARYDSYQPPQPDVVEAMLRSWQNVAKKPSLVAVVVDSSGSMQGKKMPAVQDTLQTYVNSLGPKDRLALIDFDSEIRPPVLIDGTLQGRDQGLQFISELEVDGGTKLYDAALYARNWLQQNLQKDAINAVLILTDGEDSGSEIQLDQLAAELKKSNFSTDQRIAFFTVGYGNEGEFNPEALRQIANLNGGYYSKADPATISQLMADLQMEF